MPTQLNVIAHVMPLCAPPEDGIRARVHSAAWCFGSKAYGPTLGIANEDGVLPCDSTEEAVSVEAYLSQDDVWDSDMIA